MRIRIAWFAVFALLAAPAFAGGLASREIGGGTTSDPCLIAMIAAIVVILMLITVIKEIDRNDH